MKPAKASLANLSRRERQIMEIVYARGAVTAREVEESLASPPSYSAVRAALSLLEKKGLLRHVQKGMSYTFEPAIPTDSVRAPALRQMVETFFNNSVESVVAALVDGSALKVSDEALDRIEKLISEARKKRK